MNRSQALTYLLVLIISVVFMACAWQLDILAANLVHPVKDQPFDYWFHSWTKWTHYAWTFWGMGICFFICIFVTLLNSWRCSELKVKFDLDPTVPRVVIISVLLFIEALCIPIYTVLQQGRMPNELELMMFFIAAILQLATYLLSFLGTEPKSE